MNREQEAAQNGLLKESFLKSVKKTPTKSTLKFMHNFRQSLDCLKANIYQWQPNTGMLPMELLNPGFWKEFSKLQITHLKTTFFPGCFGPIE